MPLLLIASHMALWPGLYVLGAVVCFAQISGLDRAIWHHWAVPAAFAFCTATGVYILDRVKLRDAWLDPADAVAHPSRFAFVARNATPLRVLVVTLLLAATLLGAGMFPWAAVLPPLAGAGVVIYAGFPRASRRRPKDILFLKNFYVAFGITCFAGIVTLAAHTPSTSWTSLRDEAFAHRVPMGWAAGHLAMRVLVDAALCDLDDEHADRLFGTGTLPGQLGRQRAWNLAVAIRLLIAIALVSTPTLAPWPRVTWAAVTVASSLVLRLAAPQQVRDWVDARLAIEATAVAFILAAAKGP